MKRSVCYDTVIKSVTRYRGKEINILRDKKMETKVTFIYDYQNIELPEPLVKVFLPELDAFVELQCPGLAQSNSKM